jgi:type I restriction enzyme S subunit
MKKGEKTKEIEFVKLTKTKDDILTENSICKIKYEEFEKKKYSWNYKEYYSEPTIKYGNIQYQKIIDFFDFLPKSNRQASYGNDIGNYPFYTSSKDLTKFCDLYDYDDESIILGTGGNANIKLNSKFSCSADNIIIKPNNENINIKYVYYYLLTNINKLEELFHGTTIKHLSKTDLEQIKIPVPPIPVQQIIVKELDSMYKQKESLQNAINEMDTFKNAMFEMLLLNCLNAKTVKLCELINFNGGKFTTSIMNNDGNYNFYNASIKNPIGKHSEYCFDGDEYILFIKSGGNANNKISNTHALGLSILVNGKTACVSDVLKINILSNTINVKFLYNYMKNLKDIIQEKAHYTTSLGHCDMEHIKSIDIILPSLEDQEKIVKQMSIYDNLVELQKQQIDSIDLIAKERFEFHLKKCIESSKLNVVTTDEIKISDENKISDEVDLDLSDESEKSKVKKNKSKIVLNLDKEEKSKKNKSILLEKEEPEIITICDKEYIKEGLDIYRIKSGIKYKLYGQMDLKTGEVAKIKKSEN